MKNIIIIFIFISFFSCKKTSVNRTSANSSSNSIQSLDTFTGTWRAGYIFDSCYYNSQWSKPYNYDFDVIITGTNPNYVIQGFMTGWINQNLNCTAAGNTLTASTPVSGGSAGYTITNASFVINGNTISVNAVLTVSPPANCTHHVTGPMTLYHR